MAVARMKDLRIIVTSLFEDCCEKHLNHAGFQPLMSRIDTPDKAWI
jgi:hypothetical protein